MAADDVAPAEVSDPAAQIIRASYLAGILDLETALARLQDNNMHFSRQWAVNLLSRPMSAERVEHWAGVAVTDGQITARLAEVTA